MQSGELDKDDIAAFVSIGFTHHREIIRFCKDFDERLYYIHACAKGLWSVEQLQSHLRADDYHHIGALPNNFEKTLSPMALATQAVRSFKDEYLLDLVNLDNVDARYGYETDERVLSQSMVADIEMTIQALGGDGHLQGHSRRTQEMPLLQVTGRRKLTSASIGSGRRRAKKKLSVVLEERFRKVRCDIEKNISGRFASYVPVAYKSFAGALNAFFENELPSLGGSRIRMTVVNAVNDMVARFFPETTHLTPWVTVSAESKGAYGKRIRDTGLVPVVLDLVQDVDARGRALGKKVRDVKKESVARLCRQAHEQGGCMIASELAVLLKMSAATVGKYIAEFEREHGVVLPRRGNIHDMGPTLTHKKMIIEKLFVQQETV